MDRRVSWLLAVALIAVVTGCDRKPAPKPVDAVPRIVTLTPSATEIVTALGARDLLVGVDDYSTYPPEVTSLPKVGSFLAPNIEAIAALAPTLVIVDDIHGGAAKALGELGVHAVECPMHALPDVKAALLAIGTELGKADVATQRIAAIDHALDAAAAARPAQRPRVLLVIDRGAGGLSGLVAAGPGSWLDELLAVVGGENVLSWTTVRYPKISREEILRGNPDVIIDAAFVADTANPGKDWAELADVPAVKQGRIHAAKEPFMLAPSPRVEEALAALAQMIR